MKYQKRFPFFLVSSIIIIISFACRKKDQRYEGNYVGIERYTLVDSGETAYSIDTTYAQEFQFTYSDKRYEILKIANNPGNEIFTLDQKSIVDGINISGGSYLKFSGDSLYLSYSNFSDYQPSPDSEMWDFKGKRN